MQIYNLLAKKKGILFNLLQIYNLLARDKANKKLVSCVKHNEIKKKKQSKSRGGNCGHRNWISNNTAMIQLIYTKS